MSEPARARRSPLHLSALAASAAVALGLSALTVPAAHAAETTHTIAQVQGTGATTPLNGSTVTVEGIVTADYRAQTASGYRGVFIQAEGSGAGAVDPAFGSQGLFVFLGNANPQLAIGDKIRVTGVAGEYFNQTQVSATAADAVEVLQAGAGVPAPTVLPNVTQGNAREAYEGMLVTPESAVLSSSHQLYNFGTLWLNVGEQAVKSTETTDAGPEANAIAVANRANRLLVDDGYSIQVSNNAHPGGQPYFEKDEVVRGGDRFVSPAGGMVLSWGFDDWRLQPQVPLSDSSAPETALYEPTFETENARPETAPEVGGDVQVGAFNVYNYFTTFEEPARGARSAEQFAIQKSKIVTAINGLGADIVALQEIENSVKLGKPVDSALADLVAGLNEAAGAGTWDYVRTPTALQDAATTDYITNAIIFKPSVATPVGESFTDIDETVWDIAREPVAQTFDAAGKVVTVVSNHLKSKSGDGPEPADGQGQFNAERVEQATRLAGLVQGIIDDPAKSDDVILLGDFNSYAQEDPIQVLTGAGMVDLVPTRAPGQYTYTFDGELGSLDHALVTGSLAENVTGVGVWGINSAEWSDRGYSYPATEAGTPFRSSDHDPINVGISATEAPVDIDVLSINDFHGRLVEASPAAGAAVLGGVVDQYRADNPNTLFVSAGDSIGASTFDSFVQQDQPTIDVLNEIGLDVSTFGNHEFDRGRADVDERVIPASDFPYISANIYEKGTTEPAYDPYFISEVDGVSVGFIGAITEDMYGLVSPTGIATLDFGDIPTAVNRVADQLQDGDDANGEADVLVLLVHEGAAGPDISQATNDSAFGQIVNGVVGNVDAIVSAHTHQVYDHEVPVPGTDRVMPVIQSGQYGESFGHLSLSVDPTTGELLEISAEVKPLFRAAAPDPEVAAIVANAVAVANELGKRPLGEITGDLKRGVFSNGTTENRGAESTIGNFIADVQLWATQDLGTELAIMNPGGIRADLTYASSGPGDPDGTVTYREAANVQPFANTLVTLTLKGHQLEQVLEEQWQPAGLARPFLKLGLSDGFRYAYDPTAPAGSRITAMYLDDKLVTADQSIRIVTNSFLAGGGDQFFTLAQGTQRADSGRVDLQAISDYFAAESPASPDLAQRSYGVTLSAPDADGYSAGDQVTLDLSSLAFSNGAPTTGTAVVSLGETELASAPLQFAITDFYDEQGSAQVTITIPEGVSGAQALTVSVPETGSSIDVPIEITETEEPVVLSTRTYASLSHTFASPKTAVKLSARVTAAGDAVPTGDVKVYDGTKVIATGTLDDEGRVSLTLPKFTKGIHLVTVRYQGDDGFERSLSVPDVLVVW
ncbi:5'-nucleotidase [Diaminobutyricimonas aerilata]|uniref:5'-nucleotidase n=1 Tax=Diaminobutyricimonas aerilata TaxID=1162967 RepID=A0A2M9CNG1_9MICO|nr:5'-nucleotidase [Diaminobutyricimonas aerilata]